MFESFQQDHPIGTSTLSSLSEVTTAVSVASNRRHHCSNQQFEMNDSSTRKRGVLPKHVC